MLLLLQLLRCSATSMLAGVAEPRVKHFPARLLPSAPAARFAALFAAQPRWTREQLDPYLEGFKVRLSACSCFELVDYL
jgi:hypothetical protein